MGGADEDEEFGDAMESPVVNAVMDMKPQEALSVLSYMNMQVSHACYAWLPNCTTAFTCVVSGHNSETCLLSWFSASMYGLHGLT